MQKLNINLDKNKKIFFASDFHLGVPNNKDIKTHLRSLTCNPRSKPRIGEITTSGNPVDIQCENDFTVTTASNGMGDVNNSSSVPSS